jgi:uncharacterized protein with HEPN domain
VRRDPERLSDMLEVVAVRNRVVHGYFEVDLDILWDVAAVDVPRLADQVRVIRSKLAGMP